MLSKEQASKERIKRLKANYGEPYNFEKITLYKDYEGGLEKPILGAKTGLTLGYLTAFIRVVITGAKLSPWEIGANMAAITLKGAAAGGLYGLSVTNFSLIRGKKDDSINHFFSGALTTLFVYGRPYIYRNFLKATGFGLLCMVTKLSAMGGWNISNGIMSPDSIAAGIAPRKPALQINQYIGLSIDRYKTQIKHLEDNL